MLLQTASSEAKSGGRHRGASHRAIGRPCRRELSGAASNASCTTAPGREQAWTTCLGTSRAFTARSRVCHRSWSGVSGRSDDQAASSERARALALGRGHTEAARRARTRKRFNSLRVGDDARSGVDDAARIRSLAPSGTPRSARWPQQAPLSLNSRRPPSTRPRFLLRRRPQRCSGASQASRRRRRSLLDRPVRQHKSTRTRLTSLQPAMRTWQRCSR